MKCFSVKPESSASSFLLCAILVNSLIVISGCDQQKDLNAVKPDPVPLSTPQAEPPDIALPTPSPVAPQASPAPSLATMPPPVEEPQKSLPELLAAYRASSEADARAEIIADLADQATAPALQALVQIFQSETSLDLKADILTLTGTEESPDPAMINARWSLLQNATTTNQPALLRQIAVSMLAESSDPRAKEALLRFKQDPDAEIRAVAESALEERTQN